MVLDALTAVGLAGNIIQFIDFSIKLVSKSREIYKSADGALIENKHLEETTTDLNQIQNTLRESLEAKLASNQFTQDEKALADLNEKCLEVAATLLEKLEDLKASSPRKRWKSLRQALKSVWSKEAVDSLSWTLKGLREEINTRILVHLRENVDSLSEQQSLCADAVSQASKTVLNLVSGTSKDLARDLQYHTRSLASLQRETLSTLVGETRQTRREILEALNHNELSAFRQKRAIEKLILENLRFDMMPERYEEVAEAHKNTFEWIYRESPDCTRVWSNFARWLRGDDGLYWITGKAGSGKSTLMKYLYNDLRTNNLLLCWSGTKRLVVAGFFFWGSGTELQKSLTGVLRSLLCEILTQCSELISITFPDQFQNLNRKFDLTNFSIRINNWTSADLIQALNRIFVQERFPAKYCFLIDGLDEFRGDHEEISKTINSWAVFPSVKVCVSSRPLVPFENAFEKCPSLMLQDLTYNDIKLYVETKFAQDPKFILLKYEEPEKAPVLVEEIVQKASGVFLWVKLVVASLLSGLGNGDGISDLQRRLKLLPTDLKELYQHMFLSVDQFYLQQTVKLFDIVFNSEEPLSPIELSYAEADDEYVLRPDLNRLETKEIYARYKRMDKQLKSRSKGLLEIQGGRQVENLFESCSASNKIEETRICLELLASRVEYLHKSVKDFLAEPDIWNTILRYKDPSADPLLCLFRLSLIKIKVWPWDDNFKFCGLSLGTVIDKCFEYLNMLQARAVPISAALLNELDRVVSYSLDFGYQHSIPDSGDYYLALFTSRPENERWKLVPYVISRLRRNQTDLRRLTGWPLLLLASGISSLDTYSSWCCDNGEANLMIEFLFNNGLDPNQIYGGFTVWERFLSYLACEPYWVNTLLGQVTIFLQHGADPNARCMVDMSVDTLRGQTLLEILDNRPYSESRAALIAEIHAALNSACRDRKRKKRPKRTAQGNKRPRR